ncbi:hypothetical protein BJF77_10255 [Kocuria sp. CNJ-770]|nr:hypothetical protein BJF77_10255 [Kocuria sp. CNJ-770]
MFTAAGSSSSRSLTAVTSPETGAKMSLTDLVDSISPTAAPTSTASPTSGSWTKTTSPSSLCAWSVMPMRTTPSAPGSATHSCSAV